MSIVLTGDRPTGKLHIGHYVGSIRQRLDLQNGPDRHAMRIMIADVQALTDNMQHPEKIQENVLEVAKDYLAIGLNKSSIFIQSQIPELFELTMYFMNLVSVQRMQKNPTVKNEIKLRNYIADIPLGFFSYPVSQAADITAFNASIVPAGEDQLPMIEVTREIVEKFNNTYGKTLVSPEILLPKDESCLRLPGIDGKKMSKSLNNCIYLSDTPEDIRKKVQLITVPFISDKPTTIENHLVWTYLSAFKSEIGMYSDTTFEELKADYLNGKVAETELKIFLSNILIHTFASFRNARELVSRYWDVIDLLSDNSIRFREEAAETVSKVRNKLNLIY